MLRSLVVPLEKEIHVLKEAVRSKDDRLNILKQTKAAEAVASTASSLTWNEKSTDAIGDLDEKVNTEFQL